MNQIIRVAAAVAVACLSLPIFASVEYRVDPEAVATLRRPEAATRAITMRNIPLVDGRLEDIELEPFDVMAPGAVIEFRENGTVTQVEPVPMRQFRGHVAGVPESLAYISIRDRAAWGIIIMRERKFELRSRTDAKPAGPRPPRPEGHADELDLFISEVDPADDFAIGASGYTCGVDGTKVTPELGLVPQSLALNVAPNAFTWPTATQTTMLNLVVETDSLMYANFGNDLGAVETFTRDLVGAASVIYNRDLRTDLRISHLNVNGGTDPWAVVSGSSNTLAALLEYGDYWHNTPPTPVSKRSAGVLLSGSYSGTPQNWSAGGVAWVDALCQNEFYFDPNSYGPPYGGHYFGPYAFCGGIGIGASDRVVPDPDANPNYAANASGYWPLLQFAHELGHVVESDHTHCIKYNGVDYIDECVSVGGDCYTGTTSLPAVKGTIMSYCHLNYGGTATRYTFGQGGEPSEVILDNMRARLDAKTPLGLSAITAPASLGLGAQGVASVTNTAGRAFDWTITNGTIDSGQNTNSITFTANAHPVTLRVVATQTSAGAAQNCAASDVVQVSVQAASFNPPANVVATATGPTSVQVTWSAVTGATQYKVHRASTAGSFTTLVGTTGGTSLVDNTAVANTVYQYVVTAGDGVNFSTFSDHDIAHTFTFTDPVITAQVTSAKVAHFTELLAVVNAELTFFSSPTITLPAPAPSTSTTVRAAHVTALRNGVNTARALEGLPALSYGETPTAGVTTIKRIHIQELRDGLK